MAVSAVPQVPPAVLTATPTAFPSTADPATPSPAGLAYVFPVVPAADAHFARAHHDYPATDIFAACGDTFRAPVAGVILEVSTVDRWDPAINAGATRGGLSVTLLGADGVRYYGSHLRALDQAATAGSRVTTGQPLGTVGNTGDARGIACHVHFGLSPSCGTDDWYNRRGLVYPWRYLESWRAGGRLSPAAAVRAYRAAHGCPTGPSVDP
jgi:murein DD-endopeptidase MepM/ murein hydrolase activator NlpD